MQVMFKDGTIKECSTPTEQKLFKQGEAAGWILSFTLNGTMTSNEADNLITPDNITELTFKSVVESGTENTIVLTGYEKVSTTIIRYSEEKGDSKVEIHLTKGV